MKKKVIFLGAIFAVFLLLGVTACSAVDAKTLDGVLQNVDSVSGNVTVTLTNGQTYTFNLADINLQDVLNAAKDAGLVPGDDVQLNLQRGKVKGMTLKNAGIIGVIKEVAADGSSVTITANNTDVTLKITAQTLIVLEATGRTDAAALQAGQDVVVQYDAATLTAEKIRIVTPGTGLFHYEHEYNYEHDYSGNVTPPVLHGPKQPNWGDIKGHHGDNGK